MRTFLLLLLSLMTGCEAVSNVKGCRDGWVEFTCNYPEQNGEDNNITYNSIDVIKSGINNIIQSSKINEWETTNGVSLYRDTNNKKVRVVIKKLKQQDFAEYQCEEQGSDFDTVKLDKDKDGCQGPFIQTAYRTAKTTITCNYQGNRDESDVLFFCKENHPTCEDILSTESSPKSNGAFTLTKNNTGFNVSISEVSAHHAGVYWCGLKSNEGSYRTGFRKIQLEVKNIKKFTRSPTVGQNFTYWCEYPNGAPTKKFICKGEDPSICEPLVNTMQLNKNTGRFSMEDDKKKRNITITVRDVTADDTGTYWCGAKSTDDKHSNLFFNRFSMTVVLSLAGDSWLTGYSWLTIIAVVVCVALLALLLFLVLLFKRSQHTKNTRNEEAQNNNEEAAYEEIQERPHLPDSGTALKTIYTTANFPTNPSSASHDDSNTHTYSSVKHTYQHPIYSTVNHPSGFSETPLYSTVNNPQQH